MKSFKEFANEALNPIVITFGDFNPPTVDDEKLISYVANLAGKYDYRIYASQSVDQNDNPLEYGEKIKFMRKMFPKYARNIILDNNIKTILNAASKAFDDGYNQLVVIADDDSSSELKTLLTKYNGVSGKHGFYTFRYGIAVKDFEEYDDSDMSASKLREAASKNDLQTFLSGIPSSFSSAIDLFNAVRSGLNIVENNTRIEISDMREKYISGKIFNVGDSVLCKRDGFAYVILERFTNYVLAESEEGDKKKIFIDHLVENKAYFAGLSKTTIRNRKAHFAKQTKMDDNDPNAYKEPPGNPRAKTKTSVWTKKYHDKYSESVLEFGTDETDDKYRKDTPGQFVENSEKALETKSKETGISYDILKQVFDRGMAAWKTGHRPGATQHQWGYARVNSFIMGAEGTWGRPIKNPTSGADSDLARKAIKSGFTPK